MGIDVYVIFIDRLLVKIIGLFNDLDLILDSFMLILSSFGTIYSHFGHHFTYISIMSNYYPYKSRLWVHGYRLSSGIIDFYV